jgi:hypothetical protein
VFSNIEANGALWNTLCWNGVMKNTTHSIYTMFLAFIAIAFVMTGADILWAHDGQWDSRHHYRRDNYGYWDNHDRYRHYESWHGHQGYWDDRGGSRVFISVGL